MIVAADIGGTKVDIASFGNSDLNPVVYKRCYTKDYSDFSHLLANFCQSCNIKPSAIIVGIAGPVWGDTVSLTNLDWTLSKSGLCSEFRCPLVAFLNDMEAHAYGALAGDSSQRVTINPGQERNGNLAFIAAGTGLGEAFMVWDGECHRPYACEGGHTSFAPQSSLETALLGYAQKKHHHVSAERLISGSLGFPLMRDFYADSGRLSAMDPKNRELLLVAEAVGPAVDELARAGDAVAVEMMELFLAMYGAEASNLVLKVNAVGGLYIGGGIAKKLIDWMTNGTFLAAFGNKGRFRSLMSATPIHIITDDLNALRGLAYFGRQVTSAV